MINRRNINKENATHSIEGKINSKLWNNGFIWGIIIGATITITTIIIL